MVNIHVCIFIENTHPNKKLKLAVDGVANLLLQLLPSYERFKDLKISIITKYSEYKPLSNRVNIYQIHKFKINSLDTLYFMLKSIIKIKKIHEKEPIHFININGNPFYVLSAYIVRSLLRIPILIKMPLDFNSYLRRVYMLEDNKIRARIVNFGFFKFFKIFLLKRTDFIRAINTQMVEDLIKFGVSEKKILIIPNGIDCNKFIEIKKARRNIIHFGFVGRLNEFKNLRFLLDEFLMYLIKYPKDKLFIYGRGSEESYILDYIEKNNLLEKIIFIGFERDKNKIYSDIDVIVDPALAQGISNTNLEAMCSKTFIIASNVIGNKDLIDNKRTGLLFNPYKKLDLLSKLVYYKENENEIQKIIKNAENDVLLKFDIEVITNRIYNNLKSINLNSL